MILISYEAVQNEDKCDYDQSIGGAFIKFYLYNYDEISGKEYAVAKMREWGWTPIDISTCRYADFNEYSENDADYGNILKAKIDGEVIEIHTWPVECLE